MAIDPANFHLVNVADTCSVWNLLSSQLLYSAAKSARCSFCITEFVNYECLIKPRSSLNEDEEELKRRLRQAQASGCFTRHSSDISDLQNITLLENRKRLGVGELSSIALAMKMRQAFITDDRKAMKLSLSAGNTLTQTTPHLLAWLIFTFQLSDSDKNTVINQHTSIGRPLEPHFNDAYTLALQCRINIRA